MYLIYRKSFPIKRNIAEIVRKKEQKYVRAVEDVTFSIRKGETLGLVGESGCGKSTLSKTLIRLYKPDDGKIMFDQYGDLALKEGAALTKARRDIQMVYQDPYSSLNPKMTIRQMFYEILSVHHICPKEEFEKKTIEILDVVGMPVLRAGPLSLCFLRWSAAENWNCQSTDLKSGTAHCR